MARPHGWNGTHATHLSSDEGARPIDFPGRKQGGFHQRSIRYLCGGRRWRSDTKNRGTFPRSELVAGWKRAAVYLVLWIRPAGSRKTPELFADLRFTNPGN